MPPHNLQYPLPESIELFTDDQAFLQSYIRLLNHPLPPSPVSKLFLFLSLPVCVAGQAF
jgi:hypothetical protein